MDLPWEDLRLFLAVAEAGSFNQAARRLRVGQPTVSRRIAALEELLGQPLFHRGVHGALLTAGGERLLPAAARMAEWAAQAERLAEQAEVEPEGWVRIAAPPGLAVEFLAPFAVELRKKLPKLRLEVKASVAHLDLNRGEADLALRTKAPAHGELQVLAKLEVPQGVFVHKDYAAALPKGATLADLDWIAWAPPYDSLPPNPQLAALIPGWAPAFTSDNFLVQVAAAERGMGAMMLSRLRHRLLPPTALVPLDIDLGPDAVGRLHLVGAKAALQVPRVRAVVDLLVAELANVEVG